MNISQNQLPKVDNVLGLDGDIVNDDLSLKSCQFDDLECVTKC